MPDVVVTVPKTFRWGPHVGLAAWAAEGCLPGDPGDGDLYEFSTFGACPAIRPGERVYVVCEGHVRGYAPLVQLEYAGGTVTPFSNGTEYMIWEETNCGRCRKAATREQWDAGGPFPCAIEEALCIGTITGEISADIARRMGCDEKGHAPRRCGEFEPETEVPTR